MVVKTCLCAGQIGWTIVLMAVAQLYAGASLVATQALAHPLAAVVMCLMTLPFLPILVVISVIAVPIASLCMALLMPLLIGLALLAAYLQLDLFVALFEYISPDVIWRARREVKPGDRRAALTIDDVPLLNAPSSLEEILDILKMHDAKATFMVMSGFVEQDEATAEKYKALLRRAIVEGHELANHNKFDEPAASMTAEEFDEKISHADNLLREIYGEQAWKARPYKWHRPGSGFWNQHILKTASSMGYTTALGNCFPNDVASFTRMLNAPYLKMRARPGSIILLHDRWHTPDTLRAALPALTQRLDLVTLSELQPVERA